MVTGEKKMIISRRSPFSGVFNTRDIPVTQEQLDNYNAGMVIQRAMPNISADDREFIMTGITPEEFPTEFEE